MGQIDTDYLIARAEQERELAAQSSDEIVRAIHLKMAHEYAMRAHSGMELSRDDNEASGSGESRLTLF